MKHYFTALDDAHWKCGNGFIVGMGILNFFRTMPAVGNLAGFTVLGLPLSNEFYPTQGVAAQAFEHGVAVFDPGRAFDIPPGAVGDCYLGHVDDARLNPLLLSARQQASQAKSDAEALRAQVASLERQLNQCAKVSAEAAVCVAALQALKAALAA
jgi:hypothetical protein